MQIHVGDHLVTVRNRSKPFELTIYGQGFNHEVHSNRGPLTPRKDSLVKRLFSPGSSEFDTNLCEPADQARFPNPSISHEDYLEEIFVIFHDE